MYWIWYYFFFFNNNFLFLNFWNRLNINRYYLTDRLKFLSYFWSVNDFWGFINYLRFFCRIIEFINFLKLLIPLLIHKLYKQFSIVVVCVKRDCFVFIFENWYFFNFIISYLSQSLPNIAHVILIVFPCIFSYPEEWNFHLFNRLMFWHGGNNLLFNRRLFIFYCGLQLLHLVLESSFIFSQQTPADHFSYFVSDSKKDWSG